jgi:hypothetical protein
MSNRGAGRLTGTLADPLRHAQGLFLSGGLVLLSGGIALGFGVPLGDWESVQPIELAQALVSAGARWLSAPQCLVACTSCERLLPMPSCQE